MAGQFCPPPPNGTSTRVPVASTPISGGGGSGPGILSTPPPGFRLGPETGQRLDNATFTFNAVKFKPACHITVFPEDASRLGGRYLCAGQADDCHHRDHPGAKRRLGVRTVVLFATVSRTPYLGNQPDGSEAVAAAALRTTGPG